MITIVCPHTSLTAVHALRLLPLPLCAYCARIYAAMTTAIAVRAGVRAAGGAAVTAAATAADCNCKHSLKNIS